MAATTTKDFVCEQPALYGSSHTCIHCHQIFILTDVHCPTQAHPDCWCKGKVEDEEPSAEDLLPDEPYWYE